MMVSSSRMRVRRIWRRGREDERRSRLNVRERGVEGRGGDGTDLVEVQRVRTCEAVQSYVLAVGLWVRGVTE